MAKTRLCYMSCACYCKMCLVFIVGVFVVPRDLKAFLLLFRLSLNCCVVSTLICSPHKLSEMTPKTAHGLHLHLCLTRLRLWEVNGARRAILSGFLYNTVTMQGFGATLDSLIVGKWNLSIFNLWVFYLDLATRRGL